jgi:hypothetical protein
LPTARVFSGTSRVATGRAVSLAGRRLVPEQLRWCSFLAQPPGATGGKARFVYLHPPLRANTSLP